jgi:AcrR family transcriptional regulator
MSVAEPITSDDTASRLVVAAASVFAERGYDGAGVAEIARRAGLTTGAIYSRFSGKAELLAAAISAFTADEFDHLFAQHDFDGDTTSLLNRVGLHLVTRRPDRGAAILLEAFVAARRDAEVRDVLRAHLADRARRLGELVDAGKAAGVVDPTLDTEAVVHFAHAVGLGFLAYEAIEMPHPDVDAWQEVISRVVTSLDAPSTATHAATATHATTTTPEHPLTAVPTHRPTPEPAT